MTRILVTGFGPFPGVDDNPSEKLVRNLQLDQQGVHLRKDVIPTEWLRCRETANDLYQDHRPDILIHFGVHGASEHIRLESTARNIAGNSLDACNVCFAADQIDPFGPYELVSRLPLEKMARTLTENAIPAAVTDDAGDYLCNFLYYQALTFTEEAPGSPHALFVHIPDPDRPNGLSMSQIETAARLIIEMSVDHFLKK